MRFEIRDKISIGVWVGLATMASAEVAAALGSFSCVTFNPVEVEAVK